LNKENIMLEIAAKLRLFPIKRTTIPDKK